MKNSQSNQLSETYHTTQQNQLYTPHSELKIDFGELSVVLLEYKWFIVSVMVISLLSGVLAIFVTKPIYRAEGMLQIEDKASGMELLDSLSPLFKHDTSVSAEVVILSSRMILETVVIDQKLDIDSTPIMFPLIGGLITKIYDGEAPSQPWFGLDRYAWGGETLQIDSLDVPPEYLDQPLELIAREKGKYDLYDQNGNRALSGRTGTRAKNGEFSIFVAQIIARSGTRFRLRKLSLETAVNNLRDRLSIKEQGAKSGILLLSLRGSNADRIAAVLNEIQNTFLRIHVERRSVQAEKTLEFLETQLPIVKEQVNKAEAAYNSYRQSRGSLDLTLETQGVLESLIDIDNASLKLKQEREELRQRFTPEHPTIQAVDAKLARLEERHKQFDEEINRLPDTQQTVLRLARDMEVSTSLYTELLNTVQQLKISKAGTVGDVRIIDNAAVAKKPIGAGPILILAMALAVGIVVCIPIILILRSLQVVVKDPGTVELKLGLPVYATIPHSKAEALITRKHRKGLSAGEILAIANPADDAVESLRSLRTILHFDLMDRANKSLLITSSSPGVGKSFLTINLGVVLAQLGKPVVIVDADLRRGHINREFKLDRNNGISEYVTDQSPLSEIVKPTSVPNLFVVTTGQTPTNPSEILMHSGFESLLTELKKKYDTVIVDTPPILAVSDAAIIGRHIGVALLIACAGKHPISELEQAVKQFKLSGVPIKATIFNNYNMNRQHKRYGYDGYVFQYSYKQA
ncbi:MAG: polysaccharide biosynthesis tyrosine autokinase [Candidatus Thiodiazotropha sp.]